MPKTEKSDKIQHDWLLLAYATLIFAYVLLRSILVPIHYDEILNYHFYVETGNFQPFYAGVDANNHVVSTAFNHFSFLIFGKDILMMRTFGTLVFLVYFYYIYQFRNLFRSQLVHRAFAITLLSSFFLISFFSMARGYSFSLAFILGAFYHLMTYRTLQRFKDLLLTLIFCGLALWSNLSFLFLVVVILGVLQLKVLGYLKKKQYKSLLMDTVAIMIVGIVPTYIAVKYLLLLQEVGALYLGNNENFWNAVVLDLPHYVLTSAPEAGLILLFIGVIGLILITFLNRKSISLTLNSKWISSVLIFIGIVLGAILAHQLLEVHHPRERAALPFIVSGFLLFFLLIDQVQNNWKYFALFPASVLLIDLILVLNVSYFPCFRYHTWSDEHSETVAELQKEGPYLSTIGGPGFLGRCLEYYQYKTGKEVNTFQEGNFKKNKVSDLVMSNKDYPIEGEKFDTLVYNHLTTVGLYERKKKVEWRTLKVRENPYPTFTSNLDFITIDTFNFTPDKMGHMKVEYEVDLLSENVPAVGWLVVSLTNEDGSFEQTEHIEINRFMKDYSKPTTLRKAYYFENIPPVKSNINIYLWNIEFKPMTITVRKTTYFESVD